MPLTVAVRLLRPLARRSANGVPLYGLLAHTAITLAFIYTATFQQVLLYAGFTLNLVTATTVASVFVLRRREPGLEQAEHQARQAGPAGGHPDR